ncbi:MAG: hypothetical protein AABX80_03125 [Nanoarchaeota archaeon]
MDKEIKLTEKEKYALYQCDDGFGRKEWIENDKLGITEKEAEKILRNLHESGLITFEPYKDKDLRIYEGLRTESEIEEFKKKTPPSFYTTEKGKEFVEYNPSWEE